ncbi:MAG: hypothetical protein GEU90_02010 [Gemmatimonas sp.]|nr:hypothetical protein [Gemmatimonas sp.]
MIAIMLRDVRWRLASLVPIAVLLFALEPGFHQHEGFDPGAVALGPLGISAAVSHLAALSMIVLLGGFVSTDRDRGYSRLIFAHPTSPLAYYGTRWMLAYLLSFAAAVLFLVLGQLVAWGTVLGGWSGLILPAITAIVYGGLIAFFSVFLPRGDTWLAFLFFLPTFFPQLLNLALSQAAPTVRQTILLVLPPLGAFQAIWDGLLFGSLEWGAIAFALLYGTALLAAGAILLTQREWP